jgi:hypothetical protein
MAGQTDRCRPTSLGHIYTPDLNSFNAYARAVLNVGRDSVASYGYSPATRVFEAAGVGPCIITDAWGGISEFFEPDREILVAASRPAVVELRASLTPQQGRLIGEAARARALVAKAQMDAAAVDLDMPIAQRRQTVALVCSGVFAVADAKERYFD